MSKVSREGESVKKHLYCYTIYDIFSSVIITVYQIILIIIIFYAIFVVVDISSVVFSNMILLII